MPDPPKITVTESKLRAISLELLLDIFGNVGGLTPLSNLNMTQHGNLWPGFRRPSVATLPGICGNNDRRSFMVESSKWNARCDCFRKPKLPKLEGTRP
eukprot:12429216-Karenia_brevis.AAC.1